MADDMPADISRAAAGGRRLLFGNFCSRYPALDAAKIERTKRGSGLHMFRHTAGSVVYAVTGDLKKAQEQLGHADIQTTGNIYVHSDLAQKQEAAKALELTFAADLLPTLLPS